MLKSLMIDVTNSLHFSETDNAVNEAHGGYQHVTEFIPIGQPNAQTMARIKSIKASTVIGDRALISPLKCCFDNIVPCSNRWLNCRN